MAASSEKENKKINADKANNDADIKEGTNASIRSEHDSNKYPNKLEQDKQVQGQEEYIDRNGETKDKS